MNRIPAADDGNGKARYKVVSAYIFDDAIKRPNVDFIRDRKSLSVGMLSPGFTTA
jgi:hypothetical protein